MRWIDSVFCRRLQQRPDIPSLDGTELLAGLQEVVFEEVPVKLLEAAQRCFRLVLSPRPVAKALMQRLIPK